MIITGLTGGLGNQMFQYAAGLALAEHRRTVLKLDVSWFKHDPAYEAHNRYALSCFNLTEQFATREEIDRARSVKLTRTEQWSIAVARALRLRQYAQRYAEPGNWHQPPTFAFYPEFFEQPDNTYLNGMFQSEKFFAPVADLLRLHFSFRYPSQPAVAALEARVNTLQGRLQASTELVQTLASHNAELVQRLETQRQSLRRLTVVGAVAAGVLLLGLLGLAVWLGQR